MPVTFGSSGTPDYSSGPWSSPLEWTGAGGNAGHPLLTLFQQCSYDRMYRCQPSVRKVVDKLAGLHGMVPLGVFRRGPGGVKSEAPTSALGRLIADPCSSRMSADQFWARLYHFRYLHGTAFAAKRRDALGRPNELLVIHPGRMRYGKEQGDCVRVDRRFLTEHEIDSECGWWYQLGHGYEMQVARRDLIIWQNFNPDDEQWGLSKLESLRGSLADDAGARAAMSAVWTRSARPSIILKSVDDFSERPAIIQQIQDQVMASHGGVANWAKPLVLDGGVDFEEVRIEKDLEYLELRKLTDREVGSVFDLTPPAIHDLERATFNNVEELLRDVMRTTMQPPMRSLESTLEHDLRDGRHGMDAAPDFGPAFFVDHMEGRVLRGSPEALAETRSTQLQTAQRTVNEIRAEDNLPPLPGGDRPLVNAALVALDEAGGRDLDDSGDVGNTEGAAEAPVPSASAVGSVMGRLSRVEALSDVDLGVVLEGLSAESVGDVSALYGRLMVGGGSVKDLRAGLKELELR